VGEIVASYSTVRVWLHLSAIGGLAQGLALLLFVVNIWTRIRPMGKLLQEDREPLPRKPQS